MSDLLNRYEAVVEGQGPQIFDKRKDADDAQLKAYNEGLDSQMFVYEMIKRPCGWVAGEYHAKQARKNTLPA